MPLAGREAQNCASSRTAPRDANRFWASLSLFMARIGKGGRVIAPLVGRVG